MLPVCHDQTDNPARSGPSSLVCGSWNAHAASHWNNIESCISTQWKQKQNEQTIRDLRNFFLEVWHCRRWLHFHSGFIAIWFYFLFTFIPPKLLLSKVWPVWIKWCMLNTTLKFRTIIKGFHQVYLSHKKNMKIHLGVIGTRTLISGLFSSPSHVPLGKSSETNYNILAQM